MDVGHPDESWLWWISIQTDAEIQQWGVALRSVVRCFRIVAKKRMLPSSYPSVYLFSYYQPGCHWTDFHAMLIFGTFIKIQIWLKSGKIWGTLHVDLSTPCFAGGIKSQQKRSLGVKLCQAVRIVEEMLHYSYIAHHLSYTGNNDLFRVEMN